MGRIFDDKYDTYTMKLSPHNMFIKQEETQPLARRPHLPQMPTVKER